VIFTVDGVEAAAEQGVDLATMMAVFDARLVEDEDGVWELATAFVAGLTTELKWAHFFGGTDEC